MKLYNAEQIISNGIKAASLDATLTASIIADIKTTMNAEYETTLTKMLDERIKSETGETLKALKAFVRTKVQPLIKAKASQKELLEDKAKTHTVSIKKVNKQIVEKQPELEKYLGSYRVMIEAKPQTEELTFEEELAKLMEKHAKTVADVRITLDNMAGM